MLMLFCWELAEQAKLPTSIYLANRGYKTLNIPLVGKQEIPSFIKRGKL